MPITTDLSQSPYFDDFSANSDYYKILFKPSQAVQTRELNQLQTILQNQVEKFGDNIFKRGTVIEGCNFSFLDNYPYVKIMDNQLNGETALPSQYIGYFVKNSANLQAYIINFAEGFETTDPDLKTLYVHYINSGVSGNATAFSSGQTLTVYDHGVGIQSVEIDNGGSAFSNTDTVHFISAMAVNVSTSNTFSNDEIIIQSISGAQARIIETNTTVVANTLVLKIKPINTDLANTAGNSAIWEFATGEGYTITGNTNGAVAEILEIYGSGAAASVLTDGSGRATTITMTDHGYGYEVIPHVTIKPTSNGANITDLDMTALNYLTQLSVSSVDQAVGNGYAFAVSEGTIYQKGYFSRVQPQTILVDKYSRFPNNIAIGFSTIESLINSDIDPSLLDNATGEPNETAPGADRLMLTPSLVAVTIDDAGANTDFCPLVEFSEGVPYKQNKRTAFNSVADEMALRTSEESGDYVLDRFLVTSRSPTNTAFEGNSFSVVVDPGTAYVSGYRVQTLSNYVIDNVKGAEANIAANQVVSLNYGNYIRVKELAGVFQFSTGDTVDLYDTAAAFLSNTEAIEAGTISASGTKIGTAAIRSLINETGEVGYPNTSYKAYLFNIKMNTGKNFKNVRSLYYNGSSYKGIADVVLELDGVTSANICKLYDTNLDKLIFPTGAAHTKRSEFSNLQIPHDQPDSDHCQQWYGGNFFDG
jgi:hypothetical protein